MWKMIGASLLLLAGQAYGSQAVGCKARLKIVDEQLVEAKAQKNGDRVAGLERAKRNIQAYCSDEGLYREQQQRVAKMQQEVDAYLSELQQARVAGRPDRVADKQGKLDASQLRLLEAERELLALQQLIGKS